MDSNLLILQRAEEKRKKKNEIMKRMRERRGDELKEKQKEYRKIHIEKMKKKTEIDVSTKTAKEYLVDVPINRVLIKKDKGILISRAEKIGVKGVRDKTAVDYINKISIIHKILSKNELDKELLKKILIGKENEGNETNKCNEYDVENLIKNMEYIYDVDKIIIAIYTKYTNVYSRKCHIASFMTLISYLPPNINKNGVVSYEIIRKKFEELQEEIYEERGKNRKAINEESIDNFEEEEIMRNYANLNIDEGLIYVFYTLQPPRRVEDVQLITLIKLKDKDCYCCEDTSDTNDIYDKLDNDKNYIIVDGDNNPREIVYNKYKTINIYGKKSIIITNNNLKNAIKTYILAHFLKDGDKLFNKYISSTTFNVAIKRIFSKIYNKNITLNKIRNSYIIWELRTIRSVNYISNLASMMGHSTDEQKLYKIA
jgi:hypothetical protein